MVGVWGVFDGGTGQRVRGTGDRVRDSVGIGGWERSRRSVTLLILSFSSEGEGSGGHSHRSSSADCRV